MQRSIILTLLFAFVVSCDESGDKEKIAIVITKEVTAITSTTAISGGTILSDGGSEITAKGICWDTVPEPDITKDTTLIGTGIDSFVSPVHRLSPNRVYYVRAYAVNDAGIGYGNEISFATNPALPVLSTINITNISLVSAVSGGVVFSDGGLTVTARGICWNTAPNPTINNFKTVEGSGKGSFTSHLTGLSADTKYFVRAYATNSMGTSYGNEIVFCTNVMDIDGNIYRTVVIGNQIWMADQLRTTRYNDGTFIPKAVFDTNAAAYNDHYLFGRLYNFYAIGANLAPTGWVVPSYTSWNILVNYLGGSSVAAAKLRERGFISWRYWTSSLAGYPSTAVYVIHNDNQIDYAFTQYAEFMSIHCIKN